MADKPTTEAGYPSAQAARVKSACLYIATRLGDLMEQLVVVGGLVPSLLIDQDALPEGVRAHAGTMDLDLGLSLTLLKEQGYHKLAERLRTAGFRQDINPKGNPTRQRWRIEGEGTVTVDFLIPPSRPEETSRLRDLEDDFAAIITPGLHLAFQDRALISLSGQTIIGEQATREVWVCGPGAYVALKALAFQSRGENKDAYDLFYLIQNFEGGVQAVAAKLKPLLGDRLALAAVEELGRDFLDHDGPGPRRVAAFRGGLDDNLQADVVGHIRRLLELCGQGPPRQGR